MKNRLLGISLLLFILLTTGCATVKPGTVGVKRPEVKGVTVVEVRPVSTSAYYDTTGIVKAQSISAVASKVMGTITSIAVKQGERVKAGQMLLTIDDNDMRQRLNAATFSYQEAVKGLAIAKENMELQDITYQRYQRLYDEKAIAKQQLDQIAAQQRIAGHEYDRAGEAVSRTLAGMMEAQVNQDYTRITAPLDGVVTERRMDLGSMALPGVPLIVVEDTAGFSVEANVDEKWAGKLAVGQELSIAIDSLGKSFTGSIREMVPAMDAQTHTFLIKVDLQGTELKSGLFTKVRIPTGQREGIIMLPQSCIVEKGQLTGVYVVDDSQVMVYRMVRLGKAGQGKVEIVSGLNPGERVVVAGMEQAIDGAQAVEVKSL